ncbi:MAG: cysteine--tRNA ligase [Bdellovibrionia bacterium]
MGQIQIYNSLTKKLENFEPIVPGEVKMYVCGPTVYNYLHVGNFRGPVVFNMVRNWFEHSGFKVTYALNFTDVDDKIINRAQEEGVSAAEISERYIAEYKKDFASLGLRPHDHNPKVTECMPEILDMVGDLISKKKAYAVGGDVNFSISSFADYGKLSGRNPDDMLTGVRIDPSEKKQNPLDFALWKGAKAGEPAWPSPWGPGRPGWHIECSAMIHKLFGDSIDIHGGGLDLLFPHHENEIAQSEGCSGKTFVKYWMHNNLLNFGGQKMSKSLGNFVTMRDFLERYNAEIYKWMILSVHYRSVSDFSDEAIERAVAGLAKIYSALAVAEAVGFSAETPEDQNLKKASDEAWGKITVAMDKDFNTPEVFASLFEMTRLFNSQVKRGIKVSPALQGKAKVYAQFVQKIGVLISMFQEAPAAFLIKLDDMLLERLKLSRSQVDAVVAERAQARIAKDFKRSDELRDQLLAMGISVMDTSEGSLWEVTK